MSDWTQSLLESRRRRLIVTSVTFAIGLALLWPLADDYFAEQERNHELTAWLAVAEQVAADIDRLEAGVAAETTALAGFTSRTVSREGVNEYRSRLVEMVHEAGCQLRRASVAPVESRPWREADDPLLPRGQKNNNPETGLVLKRQMVTLSVSGTMPSLRALLERIRDERMLSHTESLELKPAGRNRNTAILDVELWYFAFESPETEAA